MPSERKTEASDKVLIKSALDASRKKCGIVMPISAMGDYPASHWADVLEILTDSIASSDFEASLVSDSDDVGVIHKRIVQNLYDSPMVVCDVSGKNPNVMFELGLRLAFDKPTIVVKDNETSYSFDTSPIEHLSYPRDLRFSQIVDFKEKLSEKIRNTYSASEKDPAYSTFLKHFGQFVVPKIDSKEISGQDFIIEELRSIRKLVEFRRPLPRVPRGSGQLKPGYFNACMRGVPRSDIAEAEKFAANYTGVKEVLVVERDPGHYHIEVNGDSSVDFAPLREQIYKKFPGKVF